ncbi:MAG TPA: diguanylate cyclase, partial [Myxococcota bacterium]|nr:diguanylate cyclase [Myxococcota bacterium]
ARVERVLRVEGIFDHVIKAGDGIDGFKQMLSHPVDMILCDLIMTGIDGFKFLGLKHTKPEYNEVPVIMLTGEEDVRAKVRALEAGASDYLTKPFHDEELVARVKVHLKIKSLQDELREKNARLELLTNTDELTGLYNRRFFMEALRQEFARSERYGTALVYAMVDIDHFKRINDTHGHLMGDRALVAVAHTLQRAVRAQDVLGRYGGEEFAIVMPHTDRTGGELAVERCRKQIEEAVVNIDAGALKITASMGVVCFPRPDVKRLEDLIALADAALYKAKEAGRNRVLVAD